jgi:hypothetical protein
MIVKKNPSIFVLNLCFCLIACSTNSTHSSHDTTIVNVIIKQGKPLPAKEWHCYNVEDEKICIPSSWGFVSQNRYLFVSNLNNLYPNSYFAVKQNKVRSGYDAVSYLKALDADIKTDSVGKFTSQKITKITYSNKQTFNCEFYSTIDNKPYVTYSTVFEIDDKIFEIALKVNLLKGNSLLETYKDILYNFYYKNELVYSTKDKITGIEEINPGEL